MLRRRSMMNETGQMRVEWEVLSGTWNPSPVNNSADGLQWTCVSPGASKMTTIRCHIYNFNKRLVVYGKSEAESNYDYLVIGNLDTNLPNTITSWSSGSVYTNSGVLVHTRGKQGQWCSNIISNPNTTDGVTNHHFIDFMFGKDGSTDTQPDNATVYIDILN